MMEKFQKLALLIDAENIALDKLESVIQEISAYGRIVIQRAYGDWSKESLKTGKTR
ncbi:MAG: NYN domain-containing protein [Akkermansia sp.]